MKSQRVWIFLTRFLAKWTSMSMNKAGETGIFDSVWEFSVAGGVGGDLCAGVSFWLCGWFTGFRMLGTTSLFLIV